jgi:pimeloyl-ACP methyl ester carboxylesterase
MKNVDIGDVRLNVDVRGAGRPLLFVHGFPLDHSMWLAQLDEFSRLGYRTIAPDLRGFGRSELGAGPVTMARYADDLNRLLDALGVTEPIDYCGLSMGGYIGWQFWSRFASRLVGLVQCDTRAVADTPQGKIGRAELADRVTKIGAQAAADAMMPKLFGPDAARLAADRVERTRRAILDNPTAGICEALSGMAERPDVTPLLPQIRTPTLLVAGEHDGISTPDEMRGIAAQIPNAQFAVIPAAGHMSPLENPSAFNAALKSFLDRHPQ